MQPRNSRGIIIFLIIVAGIVAGFLYYSVRYPMSSNDAVPAPAVTVDPNVWATDKIKDVTISEETDTYTITAVYPLTANTAINTYLKSFVDDQISTFTQDAVPADTEGQRYTLDISYVTTRSAHADNIIFKVAVDTGGAHGIQATKTFSFTKTGSLIALKDLFTDEQKGLTAIAAYVRSDLTSQSLTTDEWLDAGTAPTEDNYKNFVVTDAGVRFIFDPYQVAAYAAGVVTVDVPESAFSSVVNTAIF